MLLVFVWFFFERVSIEHLWFVYLFTSVDIFKENTNES